MIENYDWIFSGIGVFLLSLIINFLFSKKDIKIIESTPIFETTNISNPEPTRCITEQDKLTQRFQYVLELMNYNSCYGGFTIAQLAKIMNLDKISTLEKYATGEEEPSFAFLKKFCETFAINYEWMTEGTKKPFCNNQNIRFDLIDYYQEIESLQPEKIYFIRCDNEVSEFFIVLKLADWNYQICQRTWHLSDHVGSTGRSQLLKFYNLVNKLRKNGFCGKCSGRTLTKENFDKLYSGEVFPGEIINSDRMDHPWWDDFTDINHHYSIAKDYLLMYGQSFINAQNIVLSELKYKEG